MRRLICAVVFTTLILANLACAATKYVIKDLGMLPGAVESIARAVNNKGQVVGTCDLAGKVSGQGELPTRSFLWKDGRMTQVKLPNYKGMLMATGINDAGQIPIITQRGTYILQNGSFKKIQGLPGYVTVGPFALNQRGDTAGWCENDKLYWKPFYRHNGVLKALPMPAHTTGIHGVAMNDKGQVIATFRLAGDKYYHALWENGKMQPIEGLDETNAVEDIANDGTIVGVHGTADGKRPFVLRAGKLADLDLPEGFLEGSADCINNEGVIAGECTAGQDTVHACVWDPNGVPTDLPTLGGSRSQANDINDAGVIVGMAYDSKGKSHAVMWMPVK